MATATELKQLKAIKGPPEYSQKVDMRKVKLEVIKPWIASRLTELMGGTEDDVLIDYTFSLLEGENNPDPRRIQLNLTGFLGAKDTPGFCTKLWKLLLSAQANPSGVPDELIEAKKQELRQEKAALDKEIEKRKAANDSLDAKSRQVDEIRQRERNERNFDRRDGGGRGGRGGGRGGRRGLSPGRDRSPPPRRRRDGRRGDVLDTYIPPRRDERRDFDASQGRRDRRDYRRRSRSRSRSRDRSDSRDRYYRRDDRDRRDVRRRSRSPPPLRRDRDDRRGGRGRTRSRSRTPERRGGRARRSDSYDSTSSYYSGSSYSSSRSPSRERRRAHHSASRSPTPRPRRRRSPSSDRSRSRSRGRSRSRSASMSRSRSRSRVRRRSPTRSRSRSRSRSYTPDRNRRRRSPSPSRRRRDDRDEGKGKVRDRDDRSETGERSIAGNKRRRDSDDVSMRDTTPVGKSDGDVEERDQLKRARKGSAD